VIIKTIFIKLSQASVLLPIITGFSNYKRLTLPYRILLYFFVSCIGFEIQASITKTLYGNNMPGLHLYTLVEFLVFSAVYYLHFKKNSILRLLIGINAIVFVGIALLDAFYIHGIMALNTLSRSYSSTSIIIYTLIYFYRLFQENSVQYIWEHPMFWICAGALIYFGGNNFYFLLKGYLMYKAVNVEWLSHFIHATLNIIGYIFYAQSFRCLKK
jgi:hypothetical protein